MLPPKAKEEEKWGEKEKRSETGTGRHTSNYLLTRYLKPPSKNLDQRCPFNQAANTTNSPVVAYPTLNSHVSAA